MATSTTQIAAKRVKGGSFLIEERQPAGYLHAGRLHRRTPADRENRGRIHHQRGDAAGRRDRGQELRRHPGSAAQGRRAGVDGRGCAGSLWRPRDGQGHFRADRRIDEPAGQLLRGVQRALRASARCRSSGTGPRSRRRSICRSSRPASGSAPTRSRNRPRRPTP